MTETAPSRGPATSTRRWLSRDGWSLRRHRPLLAALGFSVAVALAIALLSWQTLPLEPQATYGADNSWQAALHMALHYDVSFGNHFVFSYGPLGFLSVPTLWYTSSGTLAFLYTLIVRVLLAAALFAGARRSYGALPAALLAFVIASASPLQVGSNFDPLEPVAFLIFAVWVVDRLSDERALIAAMAFGGALAGVELLAKDSTGIEIAALAIVMALAARGRRPRHLLVTASALVVSLLMWWSAAGQDWGELGGYVSNSAQVVSGYAAAMGYEQPGLGWQYTAALVAVVFGLVGALAMGAQGSSRRRLGIVALWLVFCFLEFKEAFVRHDVAHGPLFFIALMGGFLALAWPRGRRLAGLALLAALFVFTLATQGADLGSVLRPGSDASSAISQIGQISSGSESAKIASAGRLAVRDAYPLTPATLRLLQGHTVAVEPYEADIAWAYGLDWRPLPTIQSYAAYTTALDRDDAAALSSAYAPQRILRSLEPAIDGRFQPFDEPLTTRTILCRYRPLLDTSGWQVLARGRNRCSQPKLIETVRAGWDEVVPVPPPPGDNGFVFVRITGVQVGTLEELRDALPYRPAGRVVVLGSSAFRLVEGTADDGLLLRAPTTIDYPAPWNLAPDAATIAVAEDGQSASLRKTITYSFYRESFS